MKALGPLASDVKRNTHNHSLGVSWIWVSFAVTKFAGLNQMSWLGSGCVLQCRLPTACLQTSAVALFTRAFSR